MATRDERRKRRLAVDDRVVEASVPARKTHKTLKNLIGDAWNANVNTRRVTHGLNHFTNATQQELSSPTAAASFAATTRNDEVGDDQEAIATATSSSTRKQRNNNRQDKKWNAMYQRLLEYKENHGDCLVPSKCENDERLGSWVTVQRHTYKKNLMTNDRIAKLEKIGFVWSIEKENDWNIMYQSLLQYKNNHGNCLVPYGYKDDPKLAYWVKNQRAFCRRKMLSNDRINKLVSIGFVWSPQILKGFEAMFQRLVQFKNTHGHCKVPTAYTEDPHLAKWISVQRGLKKQNKLLPQHVERLDSIGFVWCLKTRVEFDTMLESLLAYKNQHGDCLVSNRSKTDGKLGCWVGRQRLLKKQDRLPAEQQAKLDAIGFVWSIRASSKRDTFDAMFERLVAFEEEHGDCLVPKKYADDPKLGYWVERQRQQKKKGNLSRKQGKTEFFGLCVAGENKNSQECLDSLRVRRRPHSLKVTDYCIPLNFE